MDIKKSLKKILGLKPSENLSSYVILSKYNNYIRKKLYRKKYNTDDVINALKKIGIKKGSNIFIHSSWDSFNNYIGTPEELISALITLIGPDGTLAMPSMPFVRKKVFNVKRTVTYAGILAESFRTYSGVKRSINVQHAVCAIGPLADELLKEHHKSKIRFDEKSPYYKLCKNNFKILSLGMLPYFPGTIIHTVEATMFRELPYFAKFYDTKNLIEQRYIGYDGQEKSYFEFRDIQAVRNDYFRNMYILYRYFDRGKYIKTHVSNLQIGCIDACYTYNRLCELARKGIVLYITPRYTNL